MKRKGWPIWLLRDIPAFLGVMLSFWPLVILLISSERRVMRGKTLSRSVFETIALLLAHAEARLTFALTRQAYRRLGWNPRLVRFNLIPATYNLRDVQERYANYVNAFGDMNSVVEAYIEDIRQRYRISEREVASASAHAPVRAPLATRSKSSLADRRWGQRVALTIAAPSRRDGGGCVRTCARGPPLNFKFRKPNPNPPRGPHPRDRTFAPTAWKNPARASRGTP